MIKFSILVLVILLAACQTGASSAIITPPASASLPSPTHTPLPTATEILTPTAIPSPTATEAVLLEELASTAFEVCSPLEDETLETLPEIITHPLDIPGFGRDEGHHGVDFAYYRRGERESIEGIKIYAILSGQVVVALDDDIPYGYTLLIETPLADLPDTLQSQLMENYLPVPEDPHYRLYCPDVPQPRLSGEYSVYHLYAHMEIKPPFDRGERIECGQKLGTVGNTGRSSNPHLHLETRLGPAGAEFETMAHYENTNTYEQLGNYCLWRMSGYYQLFDPFVIFDAAQ